MSNQKAFSLFETLIVLAIVGVFATISLPWLKRVYDYANGKILQSQLLHAIQFARQEAQIRQVPVALCKSSNHTVCSGNWLDGQLVFVDQNKNGVVSSNEQVLITIQTRANRGLLHWRSFPSQRDDLLFLPTGTMRSDNGTFWYCLDNRSLAKWAISLSKTGRARVSYPNQHGVILDARGKPLQCDDQYQ
ncbi:MAG TPA: GspH/FimT family pseudopilin [Gammaproteobacteria bacterium]|nr:GspH/FimT family pseudopilin [Gammaproteobacteria bacterium]